VEWRTIQVLLAAILAFQIVALRTLPRMDRRLRGSSGGLQL
jgi:hypothetical protein